MANCLHASDFSDLVRIVPATHPLDTRWMSRLSESNAHYAIRGAAPSGVFKPFVKGFAAAHCGAPIIVAAADQEARHYLGSDYPFVIEDLSTGSVREHVKRSAAEYGHLDLGIGDRADENRRYAIQPPAGRA